jgi:hypothetical protein
MGRVKKQNERRVYAVRGFLGNAKRVGSAQLIQPDNLPKAILVPDPKRFMKKNGMFMGKNGALIK